MKKIIMVSAECFPYARTGGLAEVIPPLTEALNNLNKKYDVGIIIPFYREVIKNKREGDSLVDENYKTNIIIENTKYEGELFSLKITNKTKLYLVKNDLFFNRENLYGDNEGDFSDNAERFYFFTRFVVQMIIDSFLNPDIVHLHDWHVSLLPAIFKSSLKNEKRLFRKLGKIKTILSIHNIGYQGVLTSRVARWAGFDFNDFPEKIFGKLHDEHNRLNFLRTGIYFADKINTVSPSYAKEIQESEFGFGLEELLRTRKKDLVGILNGGNYENWDPEVDPYIPANFSKNNTFGKKDCKRVLSEHFGFTYDPQIPIIGIIARLTYQKGLDFLVKVWNELLKLDLKLIILGNGDKDLEKFFIAKAKESPQKVAICVGFNIELSHLIQSGSDMFLMPSRYEPCGLTQIHAMKYGTIPIVSATGGLKDTVKKFNEVDGSGWGFSFEKNDPFNMLEEIQRAVYIFKNREIWDKLISRSMDNDFSYTVVAKNYSKLYESL